MADNQSSPSEKQEADFRAQLGMRLVFWATAALVVLAVFMIIGAFLSKVEGEVLRVSQLLLSSLLPLFATWVGTVLAFYYTKENFESATRGTMDIVRSVSQRLATTLIKDVMMARASIIFQPVSNDLGSIPLSEIEQKFTSKGANGSQISRLHFFDKDNKAIAILHRSVWSEMMVAGLRNTSPEPRRDCRRQKFVSHAANC